MEPLVWIISGRDESELHAEAERLHDFVAVEGAPSLADIGLSLVASAASEHRAAVVGRDRQGFLRGLAALVKGERINGVVRGVAGAAASGPVFVFPGQGAQWAGMAVDLLASSPVFAEWMAECERALGSFVDWSLLDVVRGAPGAARMDRVDVVQPVLFAVMVSLAQVWRSYGVEPGAVVGHSQGEIAAAWVAGILSLTDAARIVALRSRLLLELGERGAMLSMALGPAPARELMGPWENRLSLAAVNGPESVVVSGEESALEEFERTLSAQRVLRLRVPGVHFTAHSAQVDALAGPLRKHLEPVRPQVAGVRFFSTVRCQWMRGPELDAEYWFQNLRRTVRFEEATRQLVTEGHRVFIEVSTHPVLVPGLRETLESLAVPHAAAVGSLRRDDGGLARLLASVAEVHVHGVDVEWGTVFAGSGARRLAPPR